MKTQKRTAALVAAATTAGVLAAGAGHASAAVNWNICGNRHSYALENNTRFTAETRGMEIRVRTHFRRADGTVAHKTPWVDKGSALKGAVLTFETVWTGSHPDVAYSTSVWRAVDDDGRVHRAWRSSESTC